MDCRGMVATSSGHGRGDEGGGDRGRGRRRGYFGPKINIMASGALITLVNIHRRSCPYIPVNSLPFCYPRDSLSSSVPIQTADRGAPRSHPVRPPYRRRPRWPLPRGASESPPPSTSPSSMTSAPAPVSASPGSSTQQRKRGSTESIGLYAVQCCECHKWRTVPTKDEFETLRENFTDDPWFCSKRPDCSCDDPADIEYDSSRIWVIDKPNIPKPPPKTERLLIMRGDLSKLDTYYVMPNGKRARCMGDVDKFLEANPEYKDRLSVENFSFATPKIVEETVSHSSAWKAAKAKKQVKTNASSSKN